MHCIRHGKGGNQHLHIVVLFMKPCLHGILYNIKITAGSIWICVSCWAYNISVNVLCRRSGLKPQFPLYWTFNLTNPHSKAQNLPLINQAQKVINILIYVHLCKYYSQFFNYTSRSSSLSSFLPGPVLGNGALFVWLISMHFLKSNLIDCCDQNLSRRLSKQFRDGAETTFSVPFEQKIPPN